MFSSWPGARDLQAVSDLLAWDGETDLLHGILVERLRIVETRVETCIVVSLALYF